jgi:nucleotide-binding universal stress UspA family protein
MRILLAIEASACSQAAVNEVATHEWPAGSEVEVLTVIHSWVPQVFDPLFLFSAAEEETLEEDRRQAPRLIQDTVQKILKNSCNLKVTGRILEGPPGDLIVKEAENWKADLIVVGYHGLLHRLILGSVSSAVAGHSPCPVNIVLSDRAQHAP